MTQEEVVRAVLTIKRWCKKHKTDDGCSCPFYDFVDGCMMIDICPPSEWGIDWRSSGRCRNDAGNQ